MSGVRSEIYLNRKVGFPLTVAQFVASWCWLLDESSPWIQDRTWLSLSTLANLWDIQELDFKSRHLKS